MVPVPFTGSASTVCLACLCRKPVEGVLDGYVSADGLIQKQVCGLFGHTATGFPFVLFNLLVSFVDSSTRFKDKRSHQSCNGLNSTLGIKQHELLFRFT